MAIRTENPALGKSAGLGNTSVHQGIDGSEFAQNLASAQAKFASCIMGIDPGLSGAIAFYFPDAPGRCAVEDMPVVDGWGRHSQSSNTWRPGPARALRVPLSLEPALVLFAASWPLLKSARCL
jgi:hypothetical protein